MTPKYRPVIFVSILLLFLITQFAPQIHARDDQARFSYSDMEKEVLRMMEKGNIPGLTVVIVKDSQIYIKGFGYADKEKKKPVTQETLFELASCSKAYTALAALNLEKEGKLRLDEPVSTYLPGFYLLYKGKKYAPTIRQFLHQTSGMPFNSVSRIPISDDPDALQRTVKNLIGITLDFMPGEKFRYATVNYDVVGAVIEKVSGLSYEDYMQKNILTPLGLNDTFVGATITDPVRKENKAIGYKIGFLAPRLYQPPLYRGNNPAGYITSDGKDIARWLQLQLGIIQTPLQPLIDATHVPDNSVLPEGAHLTYYGMGWFYYLNKKAAMEHSGENPNFTSYIAFKPEEKTGIAILANSNSSATKLIGNYVLNIARGKGPLNVEIVPDGIDKFCSFVSLALAFYLFITLIFYISVFYGLAKGSRSFEPITPKKIIRWILSLIAFIPVAIGIYLFPNTIANVPMEIAVVWAPSSLQVAVFLLYVTLVAGFIGLFLSTLFPHKSKYKKSLPMLILFSVVTGGANAVVIFLVTNALFSKIDLIYQVYNFALAFMIYIFGRKFLQTRLVRMTFNLVYDFRMTLIEKIFYTSYQRFEKLNRGRVFATLNDDTDRISGAANVLVGLITSIVTFMGAFIFLTTIAFWATMATLLVVGLIALLYYVVSQNARVFFEEVRDTRNVYMGLLNGMLDGFKELSMQYRKKMEFKDEVGNVCEEFSHKASVAHIKFINAFLIGESMLVVVLGCLGFGIPRLFPHLTIQTVMSFIMVLLYMIGPITAILHAIPQLMQMRIAWGRIQDFIKDVPANMKPEDLEKLEINPALQSNIVARDLEFQYEAPDEERPFSIGPIDFEARKGEVIFIIGGNGSGKTTLAKLLAGLYLPDKGMIKVDGKDIGSYQLSEYFSSVFSDYHLFERVYNVDIKSKVNEIQKYLKLLRLEKKVTLDGNGFSTINLSGGQRKRLALLLCYLEDHPIYLFDEVAADQDPGFRKFFYRNLLPRMKEAGKIIIAITHDDHYFDVADKIIKMDMGRIDVLENEQNER